MLLWDPPVLQTCGDWLYPGTSHLPVLTLCLSISGVAKGSHLSRQALKVTWRETGSLSHLISSFNLEIIKQQQVKISKELPETEIKWDEIILNITNEGRQSLLLKFSHEVVLRVFVWVAVLTPIFCSAANHSYLIVERPQTLGIKISSPCEHLLSTCHFTYFLKSVFGVDYFLKSSLNWWQYCFCIMFPFLGP